MSLHSCRTLLLTTAQQPGSILRLAAQGTSCKAELNSGLLAATLMMGRFFPWLAAPPIEHLPLGQENLLETALVWALLLFYPLGLLLVVWKAVTRSYLAAALLEAGLCSIHKL